MSNARRHILHIETGRHLYGGAYQALLLIKGLHQRGLRNTLVCPRSSQIAGSAAGYADIHPLAYAGDLDPRFPLRLRQLVKRLSPDLIHVHSRRGADYWAPVATTGLGVPLLLSRRVDNAEPFWLARWKYRRYAKIITISEQIRQVLIAEGVPAAKLQRVYSAVPLPAKPAAPDREWFRETFALPPETPVIGVVAQLIPRKGHRYLIEALPAVRREFPAVRAVFFGQGPLEGALRRACRSAGLEDAVLFAGFRRDIPRIMPCLDAVVHPATTEGLGVALLEAAASARPVVAFRAGGIPEIVENGRTGWLVEIGDRQGLSRCIRALLRHPDRAAQMGQAGWHLLRQRFDDGAMVAGNLDVYADLLARP